MFAFLILSGCTSTPPHSQSNVCSVFEQEPDWYDDAKEMQKRWGVPIHVGMAFVRHESSFREDARPPRKYILGFIPNGRVSSAYGYSQALDGTWGDYQDQVSRWSSRDDFGDAMDFIGWYIYQTNRSLGISKWDAYNQYLAYHDGRAGYKRGTYKRKKWLMNYARKVQSTSSSYSAQLQRCQAQLETRKRGWFLVHK